MKTFLSIILLMGTISPAALAKMKCNPEKHIEVSCADVKNHKRDGFCLKKSKKDEFSDSRKTRICQSLPKKLRTK